MSNSIADDIQAWIGTHTFHNLIRMKDGTWMALVGGDEGIYRGTGGTPEEALLAAPEGTFVGTLYGESVALGIRPPSEGNGKPKPAKRNILVTLGMYQPKITRR